MSTIKKTTEDGWECEPSLKEAVTSIEGLGAEIYEIKNCVRSTDLENLVETMKAKLEEALEILENIDTEVQFVTDYEEEE